MVGALTISGSIQAQSCWDVEQIAGSLYTNGSGWIGELKQTMSSHPWQTQAIGPGGSVYLSDGQGNAYCLELLTQMNLARCPSTDLADHCSKEANWQYDPECKKCTFSYKWMNVDRDDYFNFAKSYYGRQHIYKDLSLAELCSVDSCW